MHIRRAAASALVVGLALSGCADGDDPLAEPPGETAVPTPSTPAEPTIAAYPTTGPLTAAQAKTLAAAGVLLATDLPGWTVATRAADAEDDEADHAIKKCLRLPETPYLARDSGRSFDQGGVSINSKAEVTTSLDQATAELTARQGPDGARCFREYLAVPGGGELILESVPVTVTGADRVIVFRVVLSGSGPTGPVSAGGFQLLAQVGQVEISVDSFEGSRSPTYTLEKLVDLAEIVVGRVRTTATPSPSASATPTATSTTGARPPRSDQRLQRRHHRLDFPRGLPGSQRWLSASAGDPGLGPDWFRRGLNGAVGAEDQEPVERAGEPSVVRHRDHRALECSRPSSNASAESTSRLSVGSSSSNNVQPDSSSKRIWNRAF